MEQHQDQFDANELQNIARDLEEDSENTISDGEQLDTTPADNTMKELFDSEQLFEYAGYYLNRDTFQSMRAGELESVLVDVWCLRLNQLDLNRWVDKPKRIFFSTQAFLQLDSPSNWGRDDNPEQSSNQIDFEQCLDTEINNVGKLDISDAQLDPYLTSLRALYTSRIIMMPVNVHKANVIRNAEEYFVGKKL
nr:uncharacterized protein LOC109186562 [Ipomoea batatas]